MELSEEIVEKLEIIDEKIEVYFNEKNHKKIIEAELEKWELLPDPKNKYDESFFIAKSLADEYLNLLEYEASESWAKILLQCDLERVDDGEREFVLGRVYFESKDFKKSSEFFEIAFSKSSGRSFVNEDPKYLKFYKNPEKYIK